jgi:ribose 1,5-bisphosphokinase
MSAEGTLVLVVGPSGAGKDSLIAGAKAALNGDQRFVFPRRIVTREAVAELEDHDTIAREKFEAQLADGGFALAWEAHGLCYGLPGSIDHDIADGHVVVSNVSRRVIGAAREKYEHCDLIMVTADLHLRAKRLAGRGRESPDEVAARMMREGAPLPDGIEAIVVDNSGPLAAGVAKFVAALKRIARKAAY